MKTLRRCALLLCLLFLPALAEGAWFTLDRQEALAAREIASLRYDKRSYFAPQTMAESPTIQAEVLDDAQAAVQILTAHEHTEGRALYVLGHSLGGILVPQILLDSPALKGAVILAGSPRSLWDIIYDQNMAALAAMPDMDAERREQAEAQAAALRDQAKAMTADNRADLYGLPADYILSLNALELPERAKALAQPLLIMQGEQDVQVTVVNDFLAWQALLGEREGIRYRLYPELNHLFMTGDTGTIADYDIANQVDDQVSQDIAEWLIEQAGKSN